MANHFEHDQRIRRITGPWIESEGTCTYHEVGSNNCISITVIEEEAGYWAIAKYSNKPPSKVNLAMMEEVDLVED